MSPEVLLSGPAGTGKSRACLEKLHAVCLRWPGARCLIVRKTRESLTETALVTFEEKVLPANSPIAEGSRRSHRQAYHYPNGSTVVIGGLDKPGKVMSTEYDLIYIQEAIECYENDWESLTTRLRNGVVPFQQLIADTNPDRPTHWLKQRVDRGATVMLESRHDDNPTLWDRTKGEWTPRGVEYISKLDKLTGARKPRLRHGKWVQAEGVVYDEWDRQVHIVDPFEIPKGWRRIRAIDFGYSNPFVCLWIAIDDDCRMFVYRELYHTKRTVKVHAAQINELSAGETYEFTVADHDAEDRATLRENGISTIPARKEVSPGIEAVQERLKDAGDGRRRLYVFRNCLVEVDKELREAKRPCSILEEFDSYSWPKAADGKAIKEAPEKINDHACFVAGTLIDTLDGPRAIEAIQVSDMILTRAGYKPAIGCGLTCESADVFEVQLSNGRRLVGTGNHPVFVDGIGFARLDSLRYGAIIGTATTHGGLYPCLNPPASMSSSSRGSSFGDTRTPNDGPTGSTSLLESPIASAASNGSIRRSGRTPTGQSPMGGTCTTKTVTLAITTPGILNACLSPSTSPIMPLNSRKNNGRRGGSLLSVSGTWLRLGTLPRRAGLGIASMAERLGRIVSRFARHATTATPSSCPSPDEPTIGSAPTSASRLGDDRAELTTFSGPAGSAEASFPSTSTARCKTAPVHVLGVHAVSEPQSVFNLTVAEQPEYYANGVLVHNCDALRYSVQAVDRGVAAIEPPHIVEAREQAAAEEAEREWRDPAGEHWWQNGGGSW